MGQQAVLRLLTLGLWLTVTSSVWAKPQLSVVPFAENAYRLFLPMQLTSDQQQLQETAPAHTARSHTYFFPTILRPEIPKKGLGGDCNTARQVRAGWYYNWGRNPGGCGPADFIETLPQAIPMLWGDWGDGPIPQVAEADYLLLFNEPDLRGQANIPARRAAILQYQIEASPLVQRKIGAPAPSHAHPEWLVAMRDEFIGLYGRPPKWDFLPVHCYFATAEECQRHVQWFIARARDWQIPGGLWITEFAVLPCVNNIHRVGGQPGVQPAIAEADRLIAWFERTPEVTRYAWYISYQPLDAWYAFQPMPDCDTSLRTENWMLTDWGQWYRERQ